MGKNISTKQTPEQPKADRAPRKARPDQVLLSGQQIDETFGILYRSVYDLHLRQVLRAVRFPGSKRLWFRRADVEALIESSVERA